MGLGQTGQLGVNALRHVMEGYRSEPNPVTTQHHNMVDRTALVPPRRAENVTT